MTIHSPSTTPGDDDSLPLTLPTSIPLPHLDWKDFKYINRQGGASPFLIGNGCLKWFPGGVFPDMYGLIHLTAGFC